MSVRYLSIFATFARACLVRDMTFRANFLLECVTSLGWMSMNLAFYLLIFTFTPEIGKNTGWSREPDPSHNSDNQLSSPAWMSSRRMRCWTKPLHKSRTLQAGHQNWLWLWL